MRSVSADQIGHAGEMTTESVINLERRDDGVAIITLTNGKVNPLSTAVLEGLHAIADELAADLPGAVIVTERSVFCCRCRHLRVWWPRRGRRDYSQVP